MEELKSNPPASRLAEASANVWRQGWFKAVVIMMVLALTFIVGSNYGNCRNDRGDRKMGHQRSSMMHGGQGRCGGMGMHNQGARDRACEGEQSRMMMRNQQNTDCPYRTSAPIESNQQVPVGGVPTTTDSTLPTDGQ